MTSAALSEKRAARVLSAAHYRKYLPIVRRTAMRLARKVPSHISVNEPMNAAPTARVKGLMILFDIACTPVDSGMNPAG